VLNTGNVQGDDIDVFAMPQDLPDIPLMIPECPDPQLNPSAFRSASSGGSKSTTKRIAKEFGLSREGERRMHDIMSEYKRGRGLGNDHDLSVKEIRAIAREVRADGGKFVSGTRDLTKRRFKRRRSRKGYVVVATLMLWEMAKAEPGECCNVKRIRELLEQYCLGTGGDLVETDLVIEIQRCFPSLGDEYVMRILVKLEQKCSKERAGEKDQGARGKARKSPPRTSKKH